MGILVTLTVNAQPKIVAHRGYWDIEGSAQNSIRALIKADSIQCDACEFDVWLTADKKLVVNHDDHINGYVIETTSSDTILNQKLKNGEYLPSLDQFLDVAKRLTIDLVLEIKPHKNRDHEKEAVKMILGGTGADYHINVFKKNPEWIKQLHDSGLEVNIWTVSEPEEIQWCIDHGADYITTNNPELVQKMIKDPL